VEECGVFGPATNHPLHRAVKSFQFIIIAIQLLAMGSGTFRVDGIGLRVSFDEKAGGEKQA
jgi:hypothetical protein